MGSVRKLTEEEIQERLEQYAACPDPKIRDEIVLQYANLVESIGRRFVGACEPLEDLIQEGYIGLIASVDKYDGSKGVKFSTYATHFIIGQIKHYLRDKGKIIKEPAWLQELNQRMTKVIESLHQQYGRQPTEKEIADEMKMSEKTVRELLTTREVFKVTSLDGTDKEDSSGVRDSEKIKDQKVVTFQLPIEDKIVLETALEHLKGIEQQVIADHFYKGLNQTEIAKKLNISCNYVSHILRNGTKKLKRILTTDEIRDTQMQRALLTKRLASGENACENSVLDSVTSIYNSAYFTQRLEEEVSRAFRDKGKLTVMLVYINLPEDLDNYTRMVRFDDYMYNLAQTMKANLRKVDVIARFGENCFGIILPHTASNTKVVSERMESIVASAPIDPSRRANKMVAKACIGKAKYPADAEDAMSLIEKCAEQIGVCARDLQCMPDNQVRKAA